MKDVFELANLGTADVTVLAPKVISAVLEEVRRSDRIFAQFFKPNDELKKSGGSELVFVKKGTGITVRTNMEQGQTLDTSCMTYDATTIKLAKHGVALGIYKDPIRRIRRDLIRDQIMESGEVYRDAMETLALEAMFPPVTITSSSADTVTLNGTILIGIKSTIGNITSVEIGTNSKIVFGGAGTVVAWKIPNDCGIATITTTSDSLSVKDILNAKARLSAKNFNPDVLVVNEYRIGDLLYDPSVKFLEASAYKGEGEVYTGEIGKLFGMKVIVSNRCPIYGAILLNSKDLGWEVNGIDLQMEEDKFTGLKIDALFFYGYVERAYGVVNKDAYGAVAIKGTFSPPLVNPTR